MSEKFEKAKKGLACCERRGYCEGHCPYYEPEKEVLECTSELAHDALALISKQKERIRELEAAQTARVMTLEELDAIYQTKEWHTWPFNTPPYLWMTVNPDVRQTRGFWICWRDIMYSLENDSPFYVRENYGKVWKIWTAEPTDEQRKAVPWNGEAQFEKDALALIRQQQEKIKAQDEVIRALRKVGYPHNFQREPTWIVNYMYAITDVIEKAVKLG